MPLPLMAIAVGTSLLSSAGSMASMFGGSKASEAAMKANAKIAKAEGRAQRLAKIAEANALADISRGKLSTQMNEGANRGIDLSSGSPMLLASKTFAYQLADHYELYRQAEIAKIRGENIALGYEHQASGESRGRTLGLVAGSLNAASSATGSYLTAKG